MNNVAVNIDAVFCYSAEDISYCSNLHAGESLNAIKDNLYRYVAAVKNKRQLHSMACGLWISAAAAKALQCQNELHDFCQTLVANNLSLHSINGFPFGNFHNTEVKSAVYLPDWAELSRLEYTLNLANVLAATLSDSQSVGTISTVPLGYNAYWNEQKRDQAILNITELCYQLHQIHLATDKKIMVCLEMEPDCVLETTDQLIAFFQSHVIDKIPYSDYLGICFDVCHQAVMFEDIYKVMQRIVDAGIAIAKVQLSCALQAEFSTEDNNSVLLDRLAQFAEPRYLHQVKVLSDDAPIQAYQDLSLALAAYHDGLCSLNEDKQWRIHFHVPVSQKQLMHDQLQSTQPDLQRLFDFLADHPAVRPFLEVETYSWNVLPESMRPEGGAQLIAGVVDELVWVEKELSVRGLLVPDR